MATSKKRRNQSNMQDLPNDIMGDVFCRLPVKSLARFRCVCKRWRSLITDPKFVRMHIDHVNHHKLILTSTSSLQSFDYEASNASAIQLNFPMKIRQCLKVLGSCNGLLCIVVPGDTVVLWNPSTGEYKKLPVPCSFEGLLEIFGFGYDSSTDDYKVVRVLPHKRTHHFYEAKVEIYSLKTNSWRRIQGVSYDYCFHHFERGTLVNGAIYWKDHRFIKRCVVDLIVGFDLTDEEFREVQLPHDLDKQVLFQLRGLGGRLFIVQNNFCKHVIEMWAMEEDNKKEFWIKLMIIPYLTGMRSYSYLDPVCFTKNGEVLMSIIPLNYSKREKKFVIYDPKERTFRNLSICGSLDWFEETTYIESLVSPNSDEVLDSIQGFGCRKNIGYLFHVM